MTQGVLPFKYERERTTTVMTSRVGVDFRFVARDRVAGHVRRSRGREQRRSGLHRRTNGHGLRAAQPRRRDGGGRFGQIRGGRGLGARDQAHGMVGASATHSPTFKGALASRAASRVSVGLERSAAPLFVP